MSSPQPADTPKSKAHRPKKHHEEEHVAEDGEGWLVSYADMMTLLCVFFLLMMVLSKPDPKKMEEMKRVTAQYFGGKYEVPHAELYKALKAVIKSEGLEKQIQVESDESSVAVTFKGAVFFDSGSTEFRTEGEQLLTKLSHVVKKEAPGYKILVEGHTDDSPITSERFPSNWELSGNRAARVIRLFEKEGFDPRTLTAIGYSHTRPMLPNRSPAGAPIPDNQAQNRRVVLRVMKNDETTMVKSLEKKTDEGHVEKSSTSGH